jgi:hypothetical protein
MPLLSQLSAVTGRPVRRRYGPGAEQLGFYLPGLYQRKQEQDYRDEALALDEAGLDLTRLGIEEAKDQAKLSNLLGGAQVGTSGLLAAGKLKSVKDLIKNLGLQDTATTGGAVSTTAPSAPVSSYPGTSLAGPLSKIGLGFTPAAPLPGYLPGSSELVGGFPLYSEGLATGGPVAAGAAKTGLLSGMSGATIGAGLASLPIFAKTLGDYFKGQRKERRGMRESRALGAIGPTLTDFGSYQPYLEGEVEAAAGIPATAGEGSSTLQRLFGRGRFSELAQEAGYGEQLAPYQSMLSQIEQGKREGLQRFAPVARRLGLRPNVGRGDAQIGVEYWRRRREAQPTFDLDFKAGTATPIFPELEEDPYSYQNVGRP